MEGPNAVLVGPPLPSSLSESDSLAISRATFKASVISVSIYGRKRMPRHTPADLRESVEAPPVCKLCVAPRRKQCEDRR